MRNIANILVIAAAASIPSLPLAHAADSKDATTSQQGHVQQHQDATPPSASQNSDSRRDQSAQAPQSPAVITPPGTSGNNKDEIQPK